MSRLKSTLPTPVGTASGAVVAGACPAGTRKSVSVACWAEEPGACALADWAVTVVRPQAEKPVGGGATNSDIRGSVVPLRDNWNGGTAQSASYGRGKFTTKCETYSIGFREEAPIKNFDCVYLKVKISAFALDLGPSKSRNDA